MQAYAAHLNEYYESSLLSDGISDSVLAYRRGGSTNIHHANSLFFEIKIRKNCAVLAMDILGFFDNINHLYLRDQVCGILDTDRLTGHHLTVWKNITRYAWVETSDLDLKLGRKRCAYGRICSEEDFRNHVRGINNGLVRVNTNSFGIPQGTPISGLYANIYLRNFDNRISELCKKYGGIYRRYSDDIAIIVPDYNIISEIKNIVEVMLSEIGLKIYHAKTEEAIFTNGLLSSDKPIQYLGFTFDGKLVAIRHSSLDAYRRKMRRGIHAKIVAAKMKKVPPNQIFKRELYARYTHLGRRRNFISYAHRAAEIMDSDKIKKQIKNHSNWFEKIWKTELEEIYSR